MSLIPEQVEEISEPKEEAKEEIIAVKSRKPEEKKINPVDGRKMLELLGKSLV